MRIASITGYEHGGVVDVARREDQGERETAAVDNQADLGGQTAPGPPECLPRRRAFRIRRFVAAGLPFSRAPAAC
ncbi:putative transposase [Streptomyces sp. Tu6071]|nr:putative transposase [Streptomyces sp. Tu6071]